MARRRISQEPVWPAWLAEFDPDRWESEFGWQVARVKWARSRGFKQYKILPLLQAMVRLPGGGSIEDE